MPIASTKLFALLGAGDAQLLGTLAARGFADGPDDQQPRSAQRRLVGAIEQTTGQTRASSRCCSP